MDKILNDIRKLIEPQLNAVHELYHERLGSGIPLVHDINDYLFANHGKELRVILMLLSAADKVTDNTIRCAVAMEMLHNASLMHDDVVDDDDLRRGKPSVKARWGNKTAVLCGDYYLANVMLLVNQVDDPHAVEVMHQVVITMSEGELLQQQYIHSDNLNRELYYDILYRKTASLMAACCELGDPTMREFGEHFGMAFQIRDDIADTDEGGLLKPPLQELTEKLRYHIDSAMHILDQREDSPNLRAIRSLVGVLNGKEM